MAITVTINTAVQIPQDTWYHIATFFSSQRDVKWFIQTCNGAKEMFVGFYHFLENIEKHRMKIPAYLDLHHPGAVAKTWSKLPAVKRKKLAIILNDKPLVVCAGKFDAEMALLQDNVIQASGNTAELFTLATNEKDDNKAWIIAESIPDLPSKIPSYTRDMALTNIATRKSVGLNRILEIAEKISYTEARDSLLGYCIMHRADSISEKNSLYKKLSSDGKRGGMHSHEPYFLLKRSEEVIKKAAPALIAALAAVWIAWQLRNLLG